jgi:23S rRNA pseudouridine2605 synthase
MDSEKLQKVLARLGFASRRQLETWIKAGRITINGKPAKLGDRVSLKTRICIDGKHVKAASINTRVLLYNKPEGEVCTRSDEKGRPTVFDNLPELKVGRWISIGRLNINSSGLLLFTNDGELANGLMHPSRKLEREYKVRVYGEINKSILQDLKQGIKLADGMAKFESIRRIGGEGKNQWFSVIVTEGRNRLVRRLWQAKKIAINRLIRVRFYAIILPSSLNIGRFIELGVKEVNMLRRLVKHVHKVKDSRKIKEKRNGNRQKDIGRR